MKRTPARQLLAANLAALMADRPGLDTQMAIAEKSGVAQSTIGRMLRGDVSVTLDNIDAIAEAFGIAVEKLVTDCVENVSDLDKRVSGLPQSALDQIIAFIDFTKNNMQQQEGLSFDGATAPLTGSHAAVRRAAQRPMDEGTVSFEQISEPIAGQPKRRRKRSK